MSQNWESNSGADMTKFSPKIFFWKLYQTTELGVNGAVSLELSVRSVYLVSRNPEVQRVDNVPVQSRRVSDDLVTRETEKLQVVMEPPPKQNRMLTHRPDKTTLTGKDIKKKRLLMLSEVSVCFLWP